LGESETSHRAAGFAFAGLAALVGVGSFTQPADQLLWGLLIAALLGLYASYLYRGGRILIIPLPGCLILVLVLFVTAGFSLTLVAERMLT